MSTTEPAKEGPKDSGQPDPASGLRLTLGRDLVALGFIIVFASLGLSMVFFRTAADVTSVVAPIVTMVGTLVGTVFGVQVASQSSAAQSVGGTPPQTPPPSGGNNSPNSPPPNDPSTQGRETSVAPSSSARGNPRLEDF